ncbi:hypothetical protein [Bradyrhizobium sp. RDM4]|uniref:hypothetical protein n=1 Tax=Bradyrhizobium sp. RDM4 TaxID=3378765 RepID=UPI0038FCC96D
MASPKTLPLDERIKSVRAEIDAFIDARTAEIKKACPGVPEASIRRDLLRGGCQCAAYLDITAKDEAA